MSRNMNNMVENAILGLRVADALGVPVEFQSRKTEKNIQNDGEQ